MENICLIAGNLGSTPSQRVSFLCCPFLGLARMVNDPKAPFNEARGSLAFALDLLQIEGRV
jgi:hypothetical protein